MDAVRAMLDDLMGADRNVVPEERNQREPHFSDPEYCRYYLISFCPHELFPNTRTNIGPCTKVHSDEMREAYQTAPDKEEYAGEFEGEMIAFLNRLIEQSDQKIAKANRRIDAALPENPLISEDQQRHVDQLNEEISRILKQAEEAGERGDVDEAACLTRQVSQLRKDSEKAGNSLYGSYMQREKSLRVCSICGAMQSVGDSMSRFESHVTGKLHQGFEKIRSFLEDLLERKAARDKLENEKDGGNQEGRQQQHRRGGRPEGEDSKRSGRRDGDERREGESGYHYYRGGSSPRDSGDRYGGSGRRSVPYHERRDYREGDRETGRSGGGGRGRRGHYDSSNRRSGDYRDGSSGGSYGSRGGDRDYNRDRGGPDSYSSVRDGSGSSAYIRGERDTYNRGDSYSMKGDSRDSYNMRGGDSRDGSNGRDGGNMSSSNARGCRRYSRDLDIDNNQTTRRLTNRNYVGYETGESENRTTVPSSGAGSGDE